MKKIFLALLIPIACFGIFFVLELAGLLHPIELKLYDFALSLRPEVTQAPEILFIDVDDEAIEKSGITWPWPRDYMANGLLLLKEYGARLQIFDILYEQASPAGLNTGRLEQTELAYQNIFSSLKTDFKALAEALASGSLPISELGFITPEYLQLIEQAYRETLLYLKDLSFDRDRYFGQAAKAFGNAFFTINIVNNPLARPKNIEQELFDKAFVDRVSGIEALAFKAPDLIFPITPILAGAKKLGFPTIRPDSSDGVTRRIELFYEYAGKAVPQLGLVALLDYWGNPECVINTDKITLKGITDPKTGQRLDVVIPLAEDQTMLINWPKNNFLQSFRHLSFLYLLDHDRLIEDIIYNTSLLARLEFEAKLLTQKGPAYFLKNYYEPLVQKRKALLEGDNDLAGLKSLREAFVQALGELFSSKKKEELLSSVKSKSPEEKDKLIKLIEKVYEANTQTLIPTYLKIRDVLKKELKDAFCLTSWTSTSTTDIGVNPFHSEYVNVGTHAAVINTILSGQFIDNTPSYINILLSAILTALVFFLAYKINLPLLSILSGLAVLGIALASWLISFLFTGIYFTLTTPFLAAFSTFIIFNLINFIVTAREKNFIRHAFAHYLSQEVINELINDPARLKLGGENRVLTALFTDIKGFSGLSELLEPQQLVSLLNEYLSAMSDIILDLSGTIDKYIGDAIVSFFGAPIYLAQHAQNACLAAVKMKRMEKDLNEKFINSKLTPKPLFTRIGINTGEMIVGNMGTQRKLNYTIMGHHVNLAARLEGVNKQYGTQILISEKTHIETGDKFLVRKLDRVRVLGINQPLRIYELLEEKTKARPEDFEIAEIFHQGLSAFEEKDYLAAESIFDRILQFNPEDGPSLTFKQRLVQYKKNPPPKDWDGVYNLTTK